VTRSSGSIFSGTWDSIEQVMRERIRETIASRSSVLRTVDLVQEGNIRTRTRHVEAALQLGDLVLGDMEFGRGSSRHVLRLVAIDLGVLAFRMLGVHASNIAKERLAGDEFTADPSAAFRAPCW
jgi:hypothetical protein